MECKTITIYELMALGPCNAYRDASTGTPTQLTLDLFAGRKRMSIAQIIDLEISDEDKVWICTKYRWWTRHERVDLASRLARPSAKYTTDERVHNCYSVIDRWLAGDATDEELRQAAAAAAANAEAWEAWAARAAAAARAANAVATEVAASCAAWAAISAARAAEEAAWAAISAARAAESSGDYDKARAEHVQIIREFYEEKNDDR